MIVPTKNAIKILGKIIQMMHRIECVSDGAAHSRVLTMVQHARGAAECMVHHVNTRECAAPSLTPRHNPVHHLFYKMGLRAIFSTTGAWRQPILQFKRMESDHNISMSHEQAGRSLHCDVVRISRRSFKYVDAARAVVHSDWSYLPQEN